MPETMDIKLKMNSIELRKDLLQAMESSDFIGKAESITENLEEEGAGLEAVVGILRFMEEHPAFDFGTPGPLAHFVERFYGRGYEPELLASITRKPTSHTLWLLNRIINGTKQPGERVRLVSKLQEAERNPVADQHAKRLATHFLQRLSS